MSNHVQQVVSCIQNISLQVEGINATEITPDLLIFGEGSPFDSLATLLLLVELEQNIDSELIANRSLIDWYSNVDLGEGGTLNVQQFSKLLFNNYLLT